MFKLYIKKYGFRLLFIGVFFFFVTYLDYSSTSAGTQTFLNFIINEMNSDMAICYYLMIGILVTNADVFLEIDKQMQIKDQGGSGYVLSQRYCFLSALINSIGIVLLFLASSLIVYVSNSGHDLFGSANITVSTTQHLSGAVALIFSLILIFLRCMTLSLMIAAINKMTKKMAGFIIVIIITILDRWFYEAFNIPLPLNILPIEHSKIFIVEAVLPLTNSERTSYIISIIYWIIPIVILCVFIAKYKGKAKSIGLLDRKNDNEIKHNADKNVSLIKKGINDFFLLYKSGSTYLVILIIIFFSLFTFNRNLNFSMIANLKQIGTLNMFIFSAIYENSPIGLIAPFLAAVISSATLFSEIKDGEYKKKYNAISLKKYINFKLKYIACSTGIIFTLSYLVLFLLIFLFDTNASVRTIYYRSVPFAQVYDHSMLLYCFIFIIYTGVLSAVFAVLSASVTLCFRSNLLGMIMPGVLHYGLIYFTSILPISVQTITSYFIPLGLFEITSGMEPIMYLTQILFIICAGIFFIWRAYRRLTRINMLELK